MELWTHVKSTEKCKPRRHCLSESDGSSLLEGKRNLYRTRSLTESVVPLYAGCQAFNSLASGKSVTRLISRSEYHKNLKFELKQKVTWSLLLLAFVVGMGNGFLLGFNITVFAIFGKFIQFYFVIPRPKYSLDSNSSSLNGLEMFSNNISIFNLSLRENYEVTNHTNIGCNYFLLMFLLATIFGVLFEGLFVDALGRKKMCFINCLVCSIFTLLSFLAVIVESIVLFFITNFANGFICGVAVQLGPLYIIETAPYNLRGFVGGIYQICFAIGVLVCCLARMDQLLGTDSRWHYIYLLNLVAPVFIFIFLPLLPESPRHSYITCKDYNNANKALQFLRRKLEVSIDVEEMDTEFWNLQKVKNTNKLSLNKRKVETVRRFSIIDEGKQIEMDNDLKTRSQFNEKETSNSEKFMNSFDDVVVLNAEVNIAGKKKKSYCDILKTRMQWKQGMICVTLYLIPHISGIYFIYYPLRNLSSNLHLDEVNLWILVAAFYFFVTLFVPFLLDRVKKRPLLIYSLFLNMLLQGLLCACLNLQEKHNWLGHVWLAGCALYIILFAISLAPLSAIIPIELFRQDVRAKCLILPAISAWMLACILSFSSYQLHIVMREYTLLISMCACLGLLMLTFSQMVETNQLTFEEIAELFLPGPLIQVEQLNECQSGKAPHRV